MMKITVDHTWSDVSEYGTGITIRISPAAPVPGFELYLTRSQAFFLVATLLDSLELL